MTARSTIVMGNATCTSSEGRCGPIVSCPRKRNRAAWDCNRDGCNVLHSVANALVTLLLVTVAMVRMLSKRRRQHPSSDCHQQRHALARATAHDPRPCSPGTPNVQFKRTYRQADVGGSLVHAHIHAERYQGVATSCWPRSIR